MLLISEIKRDQRGQYTAHEAAFKESGGIEYAADLALTLTRPTADDAGEPFSTVRVELARDCDEDPRGTVAAYRPLFPFHGLEEVELKKSGAAAHGGSSPRPSRRHLSSVPGASMPKPEAREPPATCDTAGPTAHRNTVSGRDACDSRTGP